MLTEGKNEYKMSIRGKEKSNEIKYRYGYETDLLRLPTIYFYKKRRKIICRLH